MFDAVMISLDVKYDSVQGGANVAATPASPRHAHATQRTDATPRICRYADERAQLQPQERPPTPSAPSGVVSVLVPCCGPLEYTRLLVSSLFRHTHSPVELVFLDIGSLDGTAEYLAGVQAAASVRVEVVRTPTDLKNGDALRKYLLW